MNFIPNRFPRVLEENRNQKILVSAVLLVAAFVRVSALLSMKNTIYFDYLLWDEQIFHSMAEKIANGSYHSKSVYEFSPLPIYLMAFLYKIFSPDILIIRILHMILGVLTCLNIYLIGKLGSIPRIPLPGDRGWTHIANLFHSLTSFYLSETAACICQEINSLWSKWANSCPKRYATNLDRC